MKSAVFSLGIVAFLTVAGVDKAVAESFGVVEFAGPTLTLYEDNAGKPGKGSTKIAAADVDRNGSEFLGYDEKTRMFKVRLSSGQQGWLRKATFKPLTKASPVCKGERKMAGAPSGQSSDKRLAAGQALAEELCV